MQPDKIRQVINLYRQTFERLGIGKLKYSAQVQINLTESGMKHCHAMLDEMETFLNEGEMNKLYRWLGFIQGYLWSQRLFTLDELKDHNHRGKERK